MHTFTSDEAAGYLAAAGIHDELYAWPPAEETDDGFAFVVIYSTADVGRFKPKPGGWAVEIHYKHAMPHGWRFLDRIDLDELTDLPGKRRQKTVCATPEEAVAFAVASYGVTVFLDDDAVQQKYRERYPDGWK